MINTNNLTKLFFSIVFSFSFMHVNAQENEEALEEVVVTGSYIKGSATDGSSPVQIIGRETIEDLGATTIAVSILRFIYYNLIESKLYKNIINEFIKNIICPFSINFDSQEYYF